MSMKYVSQDEIEAYEAAMAMQQMLEEENVLAMQRDFERLPILRQVYNEAPDDVFELIVSMCSDTKDLGGLNAFRLANKRLKKVVESCATNLTHPLRDGPDSLPVELFQRGRRIEGIECNSLNLRSLEGCPSGLKKLEIDCGPHLSDLSPLASCSLMKCLKITDSAVTNISVVACPFWKSLLCGSVMGSVAVLDGHVSRTSLHCQLA